MSFPIFCSFMTDKFSREAFAKKLQWWSLGITLLLSAGGSELRAQIPMTIPKLTVQAGTVISIPINVGDLSGKDVTSFEFVVSCDTTFLRFSGVDQEKTLSSGLTMFANNHVRPYGPGRMKVVCASSQPLSGNGVLVYLTGVAQKKGGTSSLQLSNCVLNSGTPPVSSSDGSLKVTMSKADISPTSPDSGKTRK